MDQNQQKLIFKFQMFEQHIQQLQQQIQAVNQGIGEMESLNTGLSDLVGSTDKEIFAPIGRGIFVKTKLLSEDLTVDVGGKNFVKKSIPETQKTIKDQIKKLKEVKKELEDNLEKAGEELQKVFMEVQEKQGK